MSSVHRWSSYTFRYSPDQRRRILEEFHTSGLNRSRFCESRGLDIRTLSRWLENGTTSAPTTATSTISAASSSSATKPRLMPVSVIDLPSPPRASPSHERFEIRLPSGVEISVPMQFDRNALDALLTSLSSASC